MTSATPPTDGPTVALFCGSNGTAGANRAVLDLVGRLLREHALDVAEAGSVGDLAILQANLVDAPPAPVAALRAVFESADGVVLAVPEYGGGAAGGAKNALDWMVGSGSLYGRPAVVLSAGTTGGANAIEQIARTLTWQGALVVGTLGIAVPATKRDANGAIVDAATVARVAIVVDELLRAMAGDAATRVEYAAATVRALGIDPHRRAGR